MLPEVEYLGHYISADGLKPSESKVRAISEAPTPKSTTELKSFFGLLNYYPKLLPNLSSTLAPLNKLQQDKEPWSWTSKQEAAFKKVKKQLATCYLLAYFDNRKEMILSCDASQHGVGAVLAHRMEDGSEQPIAFASCTPASVEKRYSQLDKEALAIVFGVKRFH